MLSSFDYENITQRPLQLIVTIWTTAAAEQRPWYVRNSYWQPKATQLILQQCWPRPFILENKLKRQSMVTNLAQVNCKVLLKLALDHAPFPDLSVLHSTVVPGTDQGYIRCDNSISWLKKEFKRNSVRTHRSPAQQGNLQTVKAVYYFSREQSSKWFLSLCYSASAQFSMFFDVFLCFFAFFCVFLRFFAFFQLFYPP